MYDDNILDNQDIEKLDLSKKKMTLKDKIIFIVDYVFLY